MDNTEYNPYSLEAQERAAAPVFSRLLTKVYLWMTLALAVTGLTAWFVAYDTDFIFTLLSNKVVFWGIAIAEGEPHRRGQAAVTALTVQNTRGVQRSVPVEAERRFYCATLDLCAAVSPPAPRFPPP